MSMTSHLPSPILTDSDHSFTSRGACRSLTNQFINKGEHFYERRRNRHASSDSHSSVDSDRRNHNYINHNVLNSNHNVHHLGQSGRLPSGAKRHLLTDLKLSEGHQSDSSGSRSPRTVTSDVYSRGDGLREVGKYRCRVEADVFVVREDTSSGSSCGYQESVKSSPSTYRYRPDNSKAASLNNMYIETKTNMLKMVEQSLQLRLELQALQGSFYDLLHNFNQYELLSLSSTLSKRPEPEKLVRRASSARNRVKALYAARRSRLRSRIEFDSDVPKENVLTDDGTQTLSKRRTDDVSTSPPVVPNRNRKTSIGVSGGPVGKLPLTPICEEDFDKNNKLGVYVNLPINHTDTDDNDAQLSDIEGEYVTLKTDSCIHLTSEEEGAAVTDQNDTTIWTTISSPLVSTPSKQNRLISSPFRASPTERRSPCRSVRGSPVQYASSSAISELYTTSPSRDISHISVLPRTSLREQPSSSSFLDNSDSTFQYPLHSTMNYPLHSTIDPTQDGITVSKVTFGHKSDDDGLTADELDVKSLDTRTVMSEPISYKKMTRSEGSEPRSYASTHSVDDYVNAARARQVALDKNHNESRVAKSATTLAKDKYNESDFKTPSRKPQATLCKEHGLHPTFGGPCIFQTDDSMSMLTSSSDLSDNESEIDHHRSVRRCNSARDTDCDSSYLSECVDDCQTNQGFSEAEDYTATYDHRNARMRILRRQTGHTELKTPRYPVGLSESDIYHDVTAKHLSLQVNRSSLPDLSGLSSVAPSEYEDELSESTLMITPPFDKTIRACESSPNKLVSSHFRSSDGLQSANSTLVLEDLECRIPVGEENGDGDPRPLSISTATTDESPESNNGLSVPVNSPNITDSGGSSSRPTTDSYDYVDVPSGKPGWSLPSSHNTNSVPNGPNITRPPCTIGKIPTPHDLRSRNTRRSRSSSRHRVASSPSSGRSQGTRSLDMQCIGRVRRRGRSAGGRTPELDSGFSTQGSCWRGHNDKHKMRKHIDIIDSNGLKRTVVQHNAVAKNLQHDRKKALVKKLKRFNNNFYRVNSTGNLHIETLGHF